MSYSKVQIDFALACAQAKRLEEIASDMKRVANQQMAGAVQEMASCWKGESASAYFAKAETVKGNVASTAETLYSIASSIRANAKRIYDAEMAALEIAETRTSNN